MRSSLAEVEHLLPQIYDIIERKNQDESNLVKTIKQMLAEGERGLVVKEACGQFIASIAMLELTGISLKDALTAFIMADQFAQNVNKK